MTVRLEAPLLSSSSVESIGIDSQQVILPESSLVSYTSEDELVPSAELTQSIYDSYNAWNEVKYVQNELANLTPPEKDHYIKENVLSYLEEFVGKIRIKKLNGIITDDGRMDIMGSDIAAMCRKTTQIAGKDSREALEGEGVEQIIQGILEGNNRSIWISPPKVADYGFALTFLVDDYDPQLKGRPFRELLLRYPEDMNTVQTSKVVYRQIAERVGIQDDSVEKFDDYADFLAHPLVYQYDRGFADLESLYEFLDISPDDIRHAEEFRLEVQKEIQPYLEEYIMIIKEMSTHNPLYKTEELVNMDNNANVLIGAMFNIARIVQRRISGTAQNQVMVEQDSQQTDRYSNEIHDKDSLYRMAWEMHNYEKLEIQGGSNCPVSQSGGDVSNNFAFIEAVQSGLSVPDAMQALGLENISGNGEVCVTCPYCKNEKANKLVKGKYICGNNNCESNKKKK